MAVVDWDWVGRIIDELLDFLDRQSSAFCDAGYFKACLEIDDKIRPMVKAWKRDVEAHLRVEELAGESPELGAEDEEEIPEILLTEEQRRRLMEEEL